MWSEVVKTPEAKKYLREIHKALKHAAEESIVYLHDSGAVARFLYDMSVRGQCSTEAWAWFKSHCDSYFVEICGWNPERRVRKEKTKASAVPASGSKKDDEPKSSELSETGGDTVVPK